MGIRELIKKWKESERLLIESRELRREVIDNCKCPANHLESHSKY